MVGATAVLVAAALVVRAIEPPRAYGPTPEEGGLTLPEPLQFLHGGASLRIDELDAFVDEERRARWVRTREAVLSIEGCPRLSAWLDEPEGLAFEQHLGQLVRGSPEEALGALALVVALARRTEWAPGFLGGGEDAARLGELVADWLRARAPGATDDPLLYEPALSAVVLYARAMRTAYRAPMIGRDDAAYERARSVLERLVGITQRSRTPFGVALAARYGRATDWLAREDDFLAGFDQEADAAFVGLDGGCAQ